jgi:hypothetical protein
MHPKIGTGLIIPMSVIIVGLGGNWTHFKPILVQHKNNQYNGTQHKNNKMGHSAYQHSVLSVYITIFYGV